MILWFGECRLLKSRPPAGYSAPPATSASGSFDRVTSASAGIEVPQDGSLSWDRRLEIARDTGDFFRRCLEGGDRGESGQRHIQLAKRIYVVVRGKSGVCYNPVRVFCRFSDCKPLVQEGSGFADSIFSGFAFQREARTAVARARLAWPEFEEQ